MARAPQTTKSPATKKGGKSVASASPKKGPKKRRAPMNEKLVNLYAAELNSALGSSSFEPLFSRLKDDKEVGQDEAIGIASALLEAPVAASTARGTALNRIVKLHNSVATFKLKQRAVGGRSAA